ncbi:12609_t:CDS:2 [Ambispora gerdemannii]|uniref:12609_t:CDS:1 n=1 Tax=Ambispora gerdemannii TaxID=144530 RepID=A0A9N8ZZ87_9GLOM|nr:12609_t:CDS:2 [Ambispora gerdemannii]
MDAAIPRLYILLTGRETNTIFNPETWGNNTFILHVLCEGLDPGSSYTTLSGYTIHDPKPMLTKAGPYLSIVATLISAGRRQVLNKYTKLKDLVAMMNVVRGPVLREVQAFLEKNDPARQYGGLQRVVLNDDGRV